MLLAESVLRNSVVTNMNSGEVGSRTYRERLEDADESHVDGNTKPEPPLAMLVLSYLYHNTKGTRSWF